MILEVRDERPEVAPLLVSLHVNVPDDWTSAEVMARYGVAPHLRAILIRDGEREVIQHGRR